LRIALLIGVSVFIVIKRKRSVFFLFPLLLIAAGAGGNVFDNVTSGFVIDFIHIHLGALVDWPFFFNLADAYLCLGMGILLLMGIAPTTAPNKKGQPTRLPLENQHGNFPGLF
jgi:lipoprotein signal peptidase